MRLIDADALMKNWERDRGRMFDADYFIFTIESTPTIDATPVVLCKDCKHCDSEYQNPLKEKLNLYGLCESTETMVYSDDFCSYAERENNG